MPVNTEAYNKFIIARFKFLNEFPYFARAVMALLYTESNEPTMSVSKNYRLYINPEFLQTLSIIEFHTLLEHELCHLLNGHHKRGENKDLILFNIAADLAINSRLKHENKIFPKLKIRINNTTQECSCLFPDYFGLPQLLTAEEYYIKLQDKEHSIQLKYIGSGNCGSCANGKSELNNEQPYITEVECDIIKHLVAQDIREYATKQRGKIPAMWERWSQELFTPKINFRKYLHSFIRGNITTIRGKIDYTYTKISRRQSAYNNIIIPGMYKPIPRVVCILDTSGSMENKYIVRGMTEVFGLIRQLGCSIVFMSADANVHFCKEIYSLKQARVVGGGGTSMDVAIEQAAQLRPAPSCIVCITDGITPFPERKPHVPVLIVKLGDYNAKEYQIPTWAKHITINEEYLAS